MKFNLSQTPSPQRNFQDTKVEFKNPKFLGTKPQVVSEPIIEYQIVVPNPKVQPFCHITLSYAFQVGQLPLVHRLHRHTRAHRNIHQTKEDTYVASLNDLVAHSLDEIP